MGVHVMALTLSGGLPLFSRQIGNSQPLPFSLIASLNGVHMFCNSQQSGLKSTSTQDSTVVWKDYEDSITLIVAASTTNESALTELMDCIFNTIILTVGLEEVRGLQTRNIERLKRELRSCFPLMDKILDAVDLGDRNVVPTDFMSMVETVLCSDSLSLKNCLGVFAECVESLFACVLLNGCLVVATCGWWELVASERKLLSLLVDASSGDCTALDVPVFLPCKSPSVPFRLVAVCLVTGVWVVALCGPEPALAAVEQYAAKVWRPAIDLLRNLQGAPRFLPPGLQQNHHCIIGSVRTIVTSPIRR
ncbi:protein fuzzy homolog [Nilaparvata lugens]|uniref:protein fuzzy homolog n=1 Tax=Nilaparvata lugens TaxID=108931 RepID=UPI00193E852F|nr:protein fuzzy homolog [Nilaparvata lugens]